MLSASTPGHYWGLTWDYSGSGPGTLAVLAGRLLHGINAEPSGNPVDAPGGLQALMRKKWPAGTVLTRAQL